MWKWIVGAAVVVGCVGIACLVPATAPWMAKAAVVAVKGVTFGKVALVATTATGALTAAAAGAVATTGAVAVTAGVVGAGIGLGVVRRLENEVAAKSGQVAEEQKKTGKAVEENDKLKAAAKTKNQEYLEKTRRDDAPLKQADSAKELVRTASQRTEVVERECIALRAENAELRALHPAPSPAPAPAVPRPMAAAAPAPRPAAGPAPAPAVPRSAAGPAPAPATPALRTQGLHAPRPTALATAAAPTPTDAANLGVQGVRRRRPGAGSAS